MSREVKFRGWDSVNEVMLPVESINFREGYVSLNEGDNSLTDTLEMIELMQYTGLKDKNGKEIYEGDIVIFSVKGSKKINKTVMSFNKEHGAYLFGIYKGVKMPCGKKTRMNKYTRKSVNNVEVIGNIYENPELLEGEK